MDGYICPYCGEEMEEGFLQSSYNIVWHKGRERVFLNLRALHKDSIELAMMNPSFGGGVKAWLCRRCEKIVIDLADPYSDLSKPSREMRPPEDRPD